MFRSLFDTGYGCGSVYATEHGVARVEIPDIAGCTLIRHRDDLVEKTSSLTEHTALMLQRYFQGENIEFTDIPVDLGGLTQFRKDVLIRARQLFYGEICSYGQLACACGMLRAARAVGGALAANPVPIIIPCHRVVSSSGCLTGFSAPGGTISKMTLLKMEGIQFNRNRVVINQLVMHRVSVAIKN